jgi:hypothetical protein
LTHPSSYLSCHSSFFLFLLFFSFFSYTFFFTFLYLDIFISLFKALNSYFSCINMILILK